MNVLEEVIIKSPNNIDEKCGKFTIDDVTDPFILSSITRSGEHYMFSAWIKSSVAGTVSIYGEKINTTTEWSKYEIGFSSNGTGVNILFEVSATYYFYHSKLEIGNKATDWASAPEDMVDKANIISCINQTPEEISIQASKISLEGLITANSNFKILEDGSMETIGGKIGGWTIDQTSLKSYKNNISFTEGDSVDYYTLTGDSTVRITSDKLGFQGYFNYMSTPSSSEGMAEAVTTEGRRELKIDFMRSNISLTDNVTVNHTYEDDVPVVTKALLSSEDLIFTYSDTSSSHTYSFKELYASREWKYLNFCNGVTKMNTSNIISSLNSGEYKEIMLVIKYPLSNDGRVITSTKMYNRYTILNNISSGINITDSFYYNSSYFGMVFMSMNKSRLCFDSSWCTCKYGSTTLSLDDTWTCELFAR